MTIDRNAWDKSKMVNWEVKTETRLDSDEVKTLKCLWNLWKVILVKKFKVAFIELVIYYNIILKQDVSQQFQKIFDIIDKATRTVLLWSHNTTQVWIMAQLDKKKTIIQILFAQSVIQVSIQFDVWKSIRILFLLEMIAHFHYLRYTWVQIFFAGFIQNQRQ